METRTPQQNSRLNAVLALVYPKDMIADAKLELAMEFSKGRTERTSKLYVDECEALIKALNGIHRGKESTPLSRAEKKLFALRISLNWSYSKLSDFIKEQTHGKKWHTSQLDEAEVNKLVSVMEKIEVSNLKAGKS